METNYPGTLKSWLVDRVFIWWDFMPNFIRNWAEANDHY